MSSGAGDARTFTVVDGSILEGGGQILRMSLCFSALLKKPTRIVKIRAGRASPGLKAQHTCGVHLIKRICQASVEGATPGSQEIVFKPGKIVGGAFEADTGTAGSVGLLLQVAFPVLLFAEPPGFRSTLVLRGGTNADMAPQIDYISGVFGPIAQKFGAEFHVKVQKRGYFPRGGGEISVTITSVAKLQAVNMVDIGNVVRVRGISFVAGSLPLQVANEMDDAAVKVLEEDLPADVDIEIYPYKEAPNVAVGSAFGISINAVTSTKMILGGSSLGKKGKPAEKVGQEAAQEITRAVTACACVDEWAQDQVIILMALAEGKSRIRTTKLSMHTKTAIFVAERFSGVKFNVKEKQGYAIVECEGIGFKPCDFQ